MRMRLSLVVLLGCGLVLASSPARAAAPDPYRALAMEAARVRDTAAATTRTLVRQVELAGQLAKVNGDAQATPGWHEYVAAVHRIRHDMVRTRATLDRMKRHLDAAGIRPESLTVKATDIVARTNESLRVTGAPADLRDRLAKRIRPTNGELTIVDLRAAIDAQLGAVTARLAQRIAWIAKARDMADELARATDFLHDSSDDSGIDVPCFDSADSFIACFKFIVDAIELIADLFLDPEADEGPRELFRTASCATLVGLSDAVLIEHLDNMSSGPTLDGDESAILRLFSCLPCPRLTAIWTARSIVHAPDLVSSRLLYDFDGDEFDRLLVRLQACGLMDFSSFDDNSTRIFINGSDCAVLTRLSNADLRVLILHMFSGATYDEDEWAIIRLIECLPLTRVAELLRMPGLDYDEFEWQMDDEEWDRLRPRLLMARAI